MKMRTITFAAIFAVAMVSTPASAKVTAFFSEGADCKGKPETKFKAGGPSVQVTLCMTTTEEHVCGHSIRIEAENAAGAGKFQVVARKLGGNYSDPTLEKMPAAVGIASPASTHDFGGTRDNPLAPAANQALATFSLKPQATAKNDAYVLRLGKNSLIGVGKNGTCEQTSELPLNASVTLKQK
jgi:hypothetical protein